MKLIFAPKVRLIGRTTFLKEEFDDFLREESVVWESDGTSDAEVISEVAGRICYMSFASPRPGGNRAYLEHIKEVGHGSVIEGPVWNFLVTGVSRSLTHELVRHRAGTAYCLSGETLIYSERRSEGRRNGGKKRKLRDIFEMTKTHHGRSRLKLLKLRCLDEKTGEFTTGKVAGVAYSGQKPVFKVTLEGGKNITCSADHRFLTPDGWMPLRQIVGGLSVCEGIAVCGSLERPIATNGVLAYKDREWLRTKYVIENLEQEEIGRLARVSKHTVRTWVRKHGLQKPMGSWTIGREPWNKGREYTLGWKHTEEARRLFGDQKRGERNPGWKGGITPKSTKECAAVRRRYPNIHAENGGRCRLCGVTGESLEIHHVLPRAARPDLLFERANLVSLCETCHYKVNGREDVYALALGASEDEIRRTDFSLGKSRKGSQLMVANMKKIVSVTYEGVQDTYDLEMLGENKNFVANGIVTHNSQLSQRFVDESDTAFCIPPDLQEEAIASLARKRGEEVDELTADAGDVLLGVLEKTKWGYGWLATYLANKLAAAGTAGSKTELRKSARQAARCVLPNATETKLVFSLNARAARHVIEMRASPHADKEIRALAYALYERLREDSPNLFGDYEPVEHADGSRSVTTPYRKV